MTDYTDLIARLARGLQWADDGWPVSGTSDDMQAAAAADKLSRIGAAGADDTGPRANPRPSERDGMFYLM